MEACFVWYGLWKFWRLARVRGVASPDTTQKKIELAARGFADGAVSSLLGANVLAFDSDLVPLLDRLSTEVVAS